MIKFIQLFATLLAAFMYFSCTNSTTNTSASSEQAEAFQRPKDCGASMPYVRYDSREAELGGKAKREKTDDFNYHTTASEASNQEYAELQTTDDVVSWKVNNLANGVTVRFTLPDNESGESKGQKSSLDFFVNGEKVHAEAIDSRWAWQYFLRNDSNRNNISNPQPYITETASMRFDEIHFLLSEYIQPGDEVSIRKSTNDGLNCGIDFIEIEEVPAPKAKPENALSVKDFGAKGDGTGDDYNAIVNCINAAAKEGGKIVYFPEGTYNINTLLKLDIDSTKIQGAGIWYTNLYFTNDNFRSGGICGNASNLHISDIYINGFNTRRMGQRDKDGNLVTMINYGWENRVLYQDQKGICGNFGEGSVIENVWIEHFECGIWIAPYAWVEGKEKLFTTPEGCVWTNAAGKKFDVPAGLVLDISTDIADKDRTTNLRVSNVRLRNQYADGVNFAEGTSFSVFEQSDIRNCGDDGIASWSQKDAGPKTPANKGNKFRYNTVEFGWRAGGIGMFGGGGHEIHNCYIGEHTLSAGIRFTADFPGSPLDLDPANAMKVHDCVIYKCGTTSDLFGDWLASIDIHGNPSNYPLKNIQFDNITIVGSQTDGIQLWGGNMDNVTFNNVTIKGIGKGYKEANPDRTSYDINAHGGSGAANFTQVTHTTVNNENDAYQLDFK